MIYQKGSSLFNVAIYIRLSREDGDKEESDSVGNQRKLLTEYVNKHDDFILYDVYIDDGFTGTNFDRPDFHRMIADIEDNKVNCVVVKDLSRFGRNYIEAGEYLEKIFTDFASLADIPEDEKVSVYFGNGEDSLETAPRGSQHAQILDAVNVTNVADLELGDGSRVQISAEQLLAWNPDVIVVNGEPKADKSGNSAAEDILSNPDYASLKAVQDNKVYGTPNAPFSWVDRPAGPKRLIGMRWLSAVVYPEYIKCDVNEEIREFFNLFYHVDLSDEQLENVLKGTL